MLEHHGLLVRGDRKVARYWRRVSHAEMLDGCSVNPFSRIPRHSRILACVPAIGLLSILPHASCFLPGAPSTGYPSTTIIPFGRLHAFIVNSGLHDLLSKETDE